MKQKLTEFKGERDNSIIIIGDFNTVYKAENNWSRDQ